jgi:predicted metalloprotease
VARRAVIVAVVAAATLTACGTTDSGISVERATPAPTPNASTAPTSAEPAEPTEPTEPEPSATFSPVESNTLRIVGDKPPQSYDAFIAAAIEDIEAFWAARFPELSGGDAYPGLSGGVYPMWPGVGTVPGCGEPETVYTEVQANAFYCFDGDFIAFDDAELFPELARRYGDLVIGVVMAHEWGHSIQGLDRPNLAPVIYELQADCYAGAWIQHLALDDDAFLPIDDGLLRTAISGVIQFRDDPGTTSDQQGAHGSAFDRISAFQDGFEGGVVTCADYAQDPPQPLQLPFGGFSDQANEGNFPYERLVRYDPTNDTLDEGERSLPETLDEVWSAVLLDRGVTFAALGPGLDAGGSCATDDGGAVGRGVEYCADAGAVVVDEQTTRMLHGELGDFTVGLLFAEAWAEGAQRQIGLEAAGDDAEQQRDCLAGMYVATIFPGAVNEVYPDGPDFVISPGDLDEAVQMLLLLTEQEAESAARVFERLGSFRIGLLTTLDRGVFPGFDACTAG